MHLVRALLGLPPTLLLLVLAQAEASYAQDGNSQQMQRLPTAIRKMGLEPGEKFYPDQYYAFGQPEEEIYGSKAGDGDSKDKNPAKDGIHGRSIVPLFGRRPPSLAGASEHGHTRRWPVAVRAEDAAAPRSPAGNDSATSLPQAFLPPFSVHLEQQRQASEEQQHQGWSLFHRAADALARLQPRQWGCPTGTSSCESIGYPYSCCASGETCYKVTDTGLGSVGCCPTGSTCGGSVSNCGSGSQACAADLGGGCCISGYTCEGVGCVQTGSVTATASLVTTTTVVPASQASTVVVTVVITETTAGVVATTTATLTSTPVTTVTELSTTTTEGVAPVKPTSSAAGTTTTATSSTTSQATTSTTSSSNIFSQGYCPTGYYACGAVAASGCCQVGRDCESTSCPASEATVVASDSDGAVVVAGGTATATAATCASGWFMCPTSVGPIAGCCPSGYDCGTASCSLVSASSTGVVQKELPGTSSGSSPSMMCPDAALWLWGLVALCTAGLVGVL